MLENRLAKNLKRLQPWATQNQYEAYRLYDKDIPEYPYLIDRYAEHVVIYEQGEDVRKDPNFAIKFEQHKKDVLNAVISTLGTAEPNIHFKIRKIREGKEQYVKLANQKNFFPVREGVARFLVNLDDYLDTGLFLDHRPLRNHVYKLIKKEQLKSMLNLFAYTASFSVFAALAGAQVTTIDMSNTYTDWGKENFLLNQIKLEAHRFLTENILAFLPQMKGEQFDIIVLDPPSFSNSKKMDGEFDVVADHTFLIEHGAKLLSKNGRLFFSTNKRKFQLDPLINEKYQVKDISTHTIPFDFRNQNIHRVFEIKNK